MSELHREQCTPCRRGAVPLTDAEIEALSAQLPEWTVTSQDAVPRLTRSFRVPDFATALQCANRIGAIAEETNHHPLIVIEWGRVTVSWWTHTIGGLHRNDFIMAARTDSLMMPPARFQQG